MKYKENNTHQIKEKFFISLMEILNDLENLHWETNQLSKYQRKDIIERKMRKTQNLLSKRDINIIENYFSININSLEK